MKGVKHGDSQFDLKLGFTRVLKNLIHVFQKLGYVGDIPGKQSACTMTVPGSIRLTERCGIGGTSKARVTAA